MPASMAAPMPIPAASLSWRTPALLRRGHRAKAALSSVAGSAQGAQRAAGKERARENQREREWLAAIGLPGRALAQRAVLALAKGGAEKEAAMAALRRFHSLSEPLRGSLSEHWSRAALFNPAAFERLDAVALRALGQAGVAWGESVALREVAARRVCSALKARDIAAMEAVAGFWGEGEGFSAQQAFGCAKAVQTSEDATALARALPSVFFCDRLKRACFEEAPDAFHFQTWESLGSLVRQSLKNAMSFGLSESSTGKEAWRSATARRPRAGGQENSAKKGGAWERLIEMNATRALRLASGEATESELKEPIAKHGLARGVDGTKTEVAQVASRRASLLWDNVATRAGVRAAWRLSWADSGGLGVWSWGEWAWRCSRASAWPVWVEEARAARAALKEAAGWAEAFLSSSEEPETPIERERLGKALAATHTPTLWAAQEFHDDKPLDRKAEQIKRLRQIGLESATEALDTHAEFLIRLLDTQDARAFWEVASLGLADRGSLARAENRRKMELARRRGPFLTVMDEFGFYTGAGLSIFAGQMKSGIKSFYYSRGGLGVKAFGGETIRPLWANEKMDNKFKPASLLSAPKERPRPDLCERAKELADWQGRAWEKAREAACLGATNNDQDEAAAGGVDRVRGEAVSHGLEERALEDALAMTGTPWSALAQKALLGDSAELIQPTEASGANPMRTGQAKTAGPMRL